ncbi:MAG: hypothetical protein H8D34_28090 [Chloroflexi bacterium]|nr:hypothetical protein [Chloroflexota bacterium]
MGLWNGGTLGLMGVEQGVELLMQLAHLGQRALDLAALIGGTVGCDRFDRVEDWEGMLLHGHENTPITRALARVW